jgi:hypothetical protein
VFLFEHILFSSLFIFTESRFLNCGMTAMSSFSGFFESEGKSVVSLNLFFSRQQVFFFFQFGYLVVCSLTSFNLFIFLFGFYLFLFCEMWSSRNC